MEQWRFASISFKMWGELSPTNEFPEKATSQPTAIESSDNDAAKKKNDDLNEGKQEEAPTPKRSIGQAEIESAYFKVGF